MFIPVTPSRSGFFYSAFGLLLHSNLELPGIPTILAPDCLPDVEVHLGTSPIEGISSTRRELNYVSPHTIETGEPSLRMWRLSPHDLLHIEYFDGTQFWLDRFYKTVWATWPETSSLANTSSYIFGPILGVLLRLRGITCLHASAVAIDDRCVAFVGSEGAGKSTTAAAFARADFSVVSDDIVALAEREGTFQVLPAYPHLCIWPETVEALFGSPNALPKFTQEWEKRRLALGVADGNRFESRTLPLGAIYLLGSRISGGVPGVETLRPQPAHLALLTNTYGSNILDSRLRAQEFSLVARLVASVPIRQLTRADDTSRLQELCDLIYADFAALGPSPSA